MYNGDNNIDEFKQIKKCIGTSKDDNIKTYIEKLKMKFTEIY